MKSSGSPASSFHGRIPLLAEEAFEIMKILIATDGSDFSEAAVERACAFWGGRPDTVFKVVSVYEDTRMLAAEPFAVSAEYYQDMAEAARNQANHYAETAVEIILKHCAGASVSTEVLSGPPGKRITDLAGEWGADVLVVGSHGRGFWGRLLGSISDAAIHHSPCSVLVVRKV